MNAVQAGLLAALRDGTAAPRLLRCWSRALSGQAIVGLGIDAARRWPPWWPGSRRWRAERRRGVARSAAAGRRAARVDPLGGLFLAVTGGVAVAVGIYGIGYGRRTAWTAAPSRRCCRCSCWR